ncbi:aspartyl/asparaginyl beta-hydroxylase domain-containing protein [Cellvibrio sp. PSBB006]|uniref:aspartyl/asparaginyl beta-hydroxylase domain-containing protein n=1 Tax=Cellvibrio sp. PSBB006 TaxID=1987723 RepID=UPI000B3BA7DD|nr:aspartyl/asparaginyl beta-hydroxylase domain-containing protein [Cellvibrio sp. PSBB006]ARU27700.1 aspartyl beta-hydroxylase [Cellvibrio sp. PSBB006]
MEVPIACSSHDLDKSLVISCAQVPCHVRLLAMQDELAQLMQQPWVDHVNRKDYSGGWDVLPLRCQRVHVDAHPVLQGFAIANGEDWQDLPVLARCPAIKAFLQTLRCPLKSVRLMRLKAGAEIKPHRDYGLSLEHGEARLHLSLQTSDKIHFYVNHQRVPMGAGELWYINADQEHAVQNLGDEDRINLVIDCVANDWLREQVTLGWHHGRGQSQPV